MEKDKNIVKGLFVSVLDGSIIIETNCMINLETKEVTEIEVVSAEEFNSLSGEYILLPNNNIKYPVCNKDELLNNDKTMFYYE